MPKSDDILEGEISLAEERLESLVERVEGPTPGGGAYSLIYYYNDDNILVPKAEATWTVVKEYTADNELLVTPAYWLPDQEKTESLSKCYRR